MYEIYEKIITKTLSSPVTGDFCVPQTSVHSSHLPHEQLLQTSPSIRNMKNATCVFNHLLILAVASVLYMHYKTQNSYNNHTGGKKLING